VFMRADSLWAVFDTRARLDIGAITRDRSGAVRTNQDAPARRSLGRADAGRPGNARNATDIDITGPARTRHDCTRDRPSLAGRI